ncbi:MAG: HD-GYP domain-containing protein [Clostridium sp.]|uniref:HD-GYP domain-containing protein n=1 Tax=Clostridium sp. TaxID=1506 RepID=UPI002FCB0F2C
MKFVKLDCVEDGDILGQHILTMDGNTLLKEGVVLNSVFIDKLRKIGVGYVYIKDEDASELGTEYREMAKLKTEVLKSFSNVFSNLQRGEKPVFKEVLGKVDSMVEFIQDHQEINSTYLSDLKTYDNYTYIHSLNVAMLSIFFGTKLNKNKESLTELGVAGMLHDIGKTKIPIEILNKSGKLSNEEFQIMKMHPIYGYEITRGSDDITEAARCAILYHHEKLDGSGYPHGLLGKEIDNISKIVCISDVYDAVASDRVYRKAFSPSDSYEYILGGCGSLFDHKLVEIFKDNFSLYPIGTKVMLSTGEVGTIIGHNIGFPDKPIVNIINRIGSDKRINLIKKLDICIVENIK